MQILIFVSIPNISEFQFYNLWLNLIFKQHFL